MDLNPITRICLQTANGFYSIQFDATAGLAILPGTGAGVVVHAGKVHTFPAADPSAKTITGDQAALIADLTAMLTNPIVVAKPGDDLGALLGTSGVVDLLPGSYGAFVAKDA